ncbi:dTDP-4-amino-4,6-dideoxygalactose transaminase [Sneathiella chungangensis]|uniref:dTDP-4-amino-4,6-dideoxygalactose transaminase n=1 Tax=Sneathiella chungangensis TaxID=1418234 RepID=A0A845MDJ2_9PROT|nr:dTDP-4-amino-4,6-dideoxygalactose transaminase [Sneathiella chungangensis]MZR21741.1 dTDP-4-amino-4,6-dideoxygalactose transaminase [Sneathiella chungangensis]
MPDNIFLNKVFITGREATYVAQAIADSQKGGMLSGDGSFTHRVSEFLEKTFDTHQVLLTHSCTAALEMAAILADIQPGDEVIMPSYTFVSSANAFVLRGGVPVFVDVKADTMNIDENLIEAAITEKTKAIVPIHYAGAACEMDRIMQIAEKYDLMVIEDAAQAIFGNYKGRPLGTIGHLGCFSFHETKNIICGEGGALLVNRPNLEARAEIVREKGTDRTAFLSGRSDKYTWRDIGSSYLPSDMLAAFLLAQLEHGEEITRRRQKAWEIYDECLRSSGLLELPQYPHDSRPNGHMYFGLLRNAKDRPAFIEEMRNEGIQVLSHYVPLHSSPAGQKFCRVSGSLENTISGASRLVRFPMYCGIEDKAEMIAGLAMDKLRKLNSVIEA